MADEKVVKWSFYYTIITINGVGYPFAVADFDTDVPLTGTGHQTLVIENYEQFYSDLFNFCKTKPVVCTVTGTGDTNTFYAENISTITKTEDPSGYGVEQLQYGNPYKLRFYYLDRVIWGATGSNRLGNVIRTYPLLVYKGNIFSITTSGQEPDRFSSHCGVRSEKREYPAGVNPFGVGFTRSGVPICTTDDFGAYEPTTSPPSSLWGYITSIPAPGAVGPIPPYNPFEPGGPSIPTQPDDPNAPGYLPPGTFDDTSDPIPDSPLPTLSAANTGFTRIYNPTLVQVQDLARYLWTDETVIETIWNKIKQYFEDPMQAIIGFNLVPVPVPNGGTEEFKLMYIPTGVNMTVAANQFVDVDCGSVKLERFYGSALDQSPNTKVSCFLPYIGTVHLNTDEVMGTTLQVKYRVDIVSGSCVAKILVDGNVLYQYSGHCAITIPFASSDFTSYVSAAISVARLGIGLGVAAATGVPLVTTGNDPSQQTGQTVTTTFNETQTARNPTTGRQITTGTRSTVETVEKNHTGTKVSYGYLTPSNISNTVGDIMGSKPVIQHSGSFSGNTGYLGVRRPFLIIERPNMCLPEQYQHFNGYPAMITMELSECKGFTRIQQIELTGITATNPEQAEIMGLLKSGVYFDV